MLEYLVSSRVRRRLLELLWRDRARGSAAWLAREAGVPVSASYGELQAMVRAGLARQVLESGHLVYEADRKSPYAAAMRALVAAPPEPTAPSEAELDPRADAVRSQLAAHGAPLWSGLAEPCAPAPLEDVLAEACELAHRDPTVAKVLPYLLVRHKAALDFERLEHALAARRQKHAGGLMLALAAALSRDAGLRTWSERLRDKRRTKVEDFFVTPSSKRVQQLAERNTPALARTFKYRMNMALDDFRAVMEKFGEQVPS